MAFVSPSPLWGLQNSKCIACAGTWRSVCMTSAPSGSEHSVQLPLNISKFSTILFEAQERLCTQLEQIDKRATFSVDPWETEPGNGGLTRGKLQPDVEPM